MRFLSVIIPVYGNSEALEECLASLSGSTYQDFELLAADDGSPQAAAIEQVALRHSARVIRLQENRGPAAARNAAARSATGEVLVFFDSDVTVHPDTLERIAQAFQSDSGLDALMGSYDAEPNVTGLAARFRNLLHTHVHRRSSRRATTFWTGCGAVRRERFLQMGGFDRAFRRPSIEDVEFGMRLHKAGGKLLLDPEIQVKHHKQWSFFSMVRTDVVHRAMPWAELMLEFGLPRDLNFRWRDRLSALFAVLLAVFGVVSLLAGWPWAVCAAVSGALVVGLEWELFRFLAREEGRAFAAASVPLYIVHLWSGVAGFVAGLARSAGGLRARGVDRPPAALPVRGPETRAEVSRTSVKSASTL